VILHPEAQEEYCVPALARNFVIWSFPSLIREAWLGPVQKAIASGRALRGKQPEQQDRPVK